MLFIGAPAGNVMPSDDQTDATVAAAAEEAFDGRRLRPYCRDEVRQGRMGGA
jgi:hypothetical protein